MKRAAKLQRYLMGSCAVALVQGIIHQSAMAEDFVKAPAEEPSTIEAPVAQQIQNFINFGPVKFNAGASLTERYSDNIFATRNNKVGDTTTIFSPNVTASVDAGQNELNFNVGSDIGRYNRFVSENYNDYNIGTSGKYRFSPSTSLIGGAEYAWTHEGRESPDAVNGVEPTTYRQGTYWVGVVNRSGPITARVGGTINTFNFDDVAGSGGTINNRDRDRKQVEVGTRVGYQMNATWEPFVQAYLDRRDYDSPVDDFGYRRDSKGYRVAVGVRGNAGPALQGEVYAGYIRQDYSDGALRDVSVPDMGMRLSWQPASGTRVRSFIDRTVEETTLPGASSYLSTVMGVSADHALRSDLLADAHLYYTENDYKGGNRTDHLTDSGMGLKYFFAPNLFVGTDYSFIERLSTSATGGFTENRIMIRFGAQLSPAYKGDPSSAAPATADRGPGGFYTGVQAGNGTLATALEGDRGSGSLTADFGDNGWQGGAFLGYGVMLKRIYLGVEFDGENGAQTWSHDGDGGTRNYSVRKRDSYEAAVRLGYELENQALLYGRFGIVTTRFETPYLHSGTLVKVDERDRGVRYGAGTDFPLAGNFFGRMEYTYTSYGDYNVDPVGGGMDNFANAENLLRFGVGFRFNRGPDEKKVPAVDYNGFYIGLQGGHGALITDNAGLRTPPQTLSVRRAGFGTGAGIFGGYGHAFGVFYAGAEIEAELASEGWNIKRDPTGRIYSVEKNYSYGASLRGGYIVARNTLIYGRAGLVETCFSTDYATTGSAASSDQTKVGIRVGGGVEMPIGKSLQMRLDYTWTDYGSYNLKYSNGPTGTDSFKNTENLFRVGVAYKF